MLYPYISSAPYTFGRPSSPLNPNPQTSSSPPQQTRSGSSSYFSSGSGHGHPTSPTPAPMSSHKTRYKRPESATSKKYLQSAPTELFAEGTTPTEGLMWRERFSRRMEDREKRRKSREVENDRRRVIVEEEEDEVKAREDDEEIFRRLMVLQRKREQRAVQISYELENGGSDPISPEFWDEAEDEEEAEWAREQGRHGLDLEMKMEMRENEPGPSNYQTPQRPNARPVRQVRAEQAHELEEDQWAAEAARAEEEEREAEEAELARQIEEAYKHTQAHINNNNVRSLSHAHSHDQHRIPNSEMAIDDIEMDWDVDMDL